ncbi:MAG: 2-oxoacid:acceptor oxidoreductase family protein [Candidatus Marinimicrobia bacterium]|jgi:pyruvate ferredoxin oxidoreductase gamma subunit|nr:2-oxoacid:acceptor oxidoreductase family protein [Candidatus Neomarinimicrobiota bacterium]|tara:strand:- start:4754 stop:5344 length:591 start_codon:yes stop_codon:yes gene_type:complete
MFQTRIHGRGGQGVVTAAELLSVAAFIEGHHAQAFPSFGSERTGAPVVSYCRIDDKEIRLREPILEPDAIIIQDPTLFSSLDVFQGLKSDGYVLLNSNKSFKELGVYDIIAKVPDKHAYYVPATEIAIKHMGRPMPNAVLLGGFAAMSNLLAFKSVEKAIRSKFSGKIGDGNVSAALAAFDNVKKTYVNEEKEKKQ